LSQWEPVIIPWIVRTGLRLLGLSRRAYREFLDVQLVENIVVLPSLPRAFDGFRLLQISDLHSDIDPALIDRVIELLDLARFDLCVLTGDYHNQIGDAWDESLALTLRLMPHLGREPLAILGNHDFLAKVPAFEAGGLRVLLNESVAIERDGARVWICGVDDAHVFGTHDLRAASAGIPDGECRLLLSHSPETWREAADLGYALHLSGHTHGGQICLPGGFPIVRKAPVPRPLLAGPWREGEMLGYTSRGTGSCSVPARLNCPPEITIHILKCA
jgi:predicted MPP superfamily phosphohydrolase